MIKEILIVISFIIWLFGSTYFGVAGLCRANMDEAISSIEKNKLAFSTDSTKYLINDFTVNKYEFEIYKEMQSVEKFFPWTTEISLFMGLLLTAFSFGILGSLIRIILHVAYDNVPVAKLKIWSLPTLGMLTALVVLGLAYVLPAILIRNADGLRPTTLMFLCLFSGIYSKNMYEKLSQNFSKIFL